MSTNDITRKFTMKKIEKEILLNIMYTGTYLTDGNIGHEVINLFKADNGHNYIYVLPYGTMDKKHNGKIETILLVKRCNSKVIEILAKAEGLKQIETNSKAQEEYIEHEAISYDGISLKKIFEDNTENGNYLTFKAQKVTKVSKPIFITTDESLCNDTFFLLKSDINFPKQSPKTYISSIHQIEAYNTLRNIIKDKESWKEKTKTLDKYKSFIKNNYDSKDYNFINIIKKDYDELVFSNLFQYIFSSNLEGFNLFAKEVLELNIDFSNQLVIEREKANIDLFITDENNAIVIENKIKSHINGICKNDEDEIINNQLSKYYTYVENNYINKQKKYFVFSPNYNQIDLSVYHKGSKYKLIHYSNIYNFFDKNKNLYKDIKYFNEFLHALHRHTSNTDNSNEEEMFERFLNVIKKKQ